MIQRAERKGADTAGWVNTFCVLHMVLVHWLQALNQPHDDRPVLTANHIFTVQRTHDLAN
eukprot:CAMPEP_0182805376 /NCGR_PEP_ID=MMETSP0006_2-20121128/5042_1 /TAXON_ID=97485 /ORGANISM="Prymnesium parvum, Strain Texoma1" /LENGTH=59 /DNA_ID=CAMNT_0024930939 /DNA_START=187 /DNA_END=366 /DNA_ORIENTATION=+